MNEMIAAFDGFKRLMNLSVTLLGFSFTLLELIMYFAIVGLVCWLIGGLLK